MSDIDGYNTDITSDQKQKLRQLFPEVFVEDKIDWNKLKATLGEDIELGDKYGLSWNGKSGVFAKIQEKTTSTLHPQPEQSVDWDTTQNMFIEGDNLEALKVLHKAYYGKIKMIYIDPPYNTGNDFIYNDNFKKTKKEQALEDGLIDEEGNATRKDGLRANTGGHKHSNWLDMMYPRLFLARNLLRQDGVIFISIDDNEVHNLRLMMNEIFGEENFVLQFTTQSNPRGRQTTRLPFALTHEYVLVYARNITEVKLNSKTLTDDQRNEYNLSDQKGRYRLLGLRKRGTASNRADRPNLFYPIYYSPTTHALSLRKTDNYIEIVPKKEDRSDGVWRWGKEKVSSNADCLAIRLVTRKSGEKEYDIFVKDYLESETGERGAKFKSVLLDKKYNNEFGTEATSQLFENKKLFDFPKPVTLIKDLVQFGLTEGITLDFFSGSGTFAHALNQLNAEDGGNRRWICVQLPEQVGAQSEAHKAGYKTIADISRERIRRASAKISKDFASQIAKREKPIDLGFRSYVLGDSNFKKWNELMREPDEIRQATLDQLNPIQDNASDDELLAEILLKHGISPLIEMEKHDDFVFIPSEALAVSLSRHMTEELFATILTKSPSQIILLDQAFKDDVNLKTNLALQAEKQNISVEII